SIKSSVLDSLYSSRPRRTKFSLAGQGKKNAGLKINCLSM
ncbi:unnamed protein product, partial [Allacma fusca]